MFEEKDILSGVLHAMVEAENGIDEIRAVLLAETETYASSPAERW